MPDTEEILCVSAGGGVVAVVSLQGPIVSLACYNTTIMAIYHSTDPGVSDQHMAMDIIALNGRQVRCKTVNFPLTPAAKLSWVGATDAGSPCAYDSAGVLRLYDISSAVWMPVCDTSAHSRGASDSWFIVSIPLCEMDTEKSEYEEQLVRWAHTAADVDVKAARETALKLFALACRSEIEQRALELMELLKDDRLLPLAAKYASRLGRVHLAEKLTNLSETWEKDNERLNEAQNSHFQELETQETYDVTSTQDLNESLIIPQKATEKKQETATIKPMPIRPSSGGSRNPFKKSSESAKQVQSPLTLTDRTLVDNIDDTTENNDPLKPRVGESFMDWFGRNKTTLEQQNSELTPSELTRHGVRMFKNIQANDNNTPDSKKRRLDEETNSSDSPVTSAPKQSKLSAFAFQKKT
ncbi:hypothetical protein O3G_MSEX006602 [Manduca sexta]|uniref:Minichromosome loss protein Mcl1 middle region domain-containing protein n=1 Tax=Manduca sexta TaxID=7130 RepID=A0A922CLQ8_MANSE|nr:hypothetical protein O3G_MSEX006602 [Manduca sexta]